MPPKGTKAAGKPLWESVLSEYDLEEHERALLVEAVRTVDLLDELDALVRTEGAVVSSLQGQTSAMTDGDRLNNKIDRLEKAVREGARDGTREGTRESRRSRRTTVSSGGTYGDPVVTRRSLAWRRRHRRLPGRE